MKTIASLLFLVLPLAVLSQVGVGTKTPAGNMEVTSGDSSNYGFVVPVVERVSDVINPQGGGIKEGTIVFEKFNNTLCFYRDSQWVAIDPGYVFQPGHFHNAAEYQTYVKAINTGVQDYFGRALAVSNDGATLVVGATGEDDYVTGVGSPDGSNSSSASGAVYVYVKSGGTWSFQQYIKATNGWMGDIFGFSLAISSDGNTLAVSAVGEDDNVTGVTSPNGSNSASASGAVYIYVRSGSTWSFQQYIKATNTQYNDQFGYSIALSHDGNTLAVSAVNEADSSRGVTTPDGNNTLSQSGAVYIYTRSGSTWSFQQYIKAINPGLGDMFGYRLDLSGSGNTLAVSAIYESDSVAGVTSPDSSNTASHSGAVYVYVRSGSTWSFQQYIKAINPQASDKFGSDLVLSQDGNTLAVSAPYEGDDVSGVTSPDGSNSAWGSGAVYIYVRSGSTWTHQQYIKSVNNQYGDYFGYDISLSNDGNVLGVTAPVEAGPGTGICEPDFSNSTSTAGAAYIYLRDGSTWSFDQYIKAINTGAQDRFGYDIDLSGDGGVLVVGADLEDDNVTGVTTPNGGNGSQDSGAAYIYE